MWLAIEGIVGAGKTTTAELIGDQTDLAPLIERSDQHPLLDAYYRDPPQFALETELAFMVLQAHQVRVTNVNTRFVSDFAPAKNFVFARQVCDPSDLELLRDVDRRLWRDLPGPDLTIVLDVPTDVCMRRIALRARDYERGLTVADLGRLREGYLESLEDLGAEVRHLGLNGTETPLEVAIEAIETAGLSRQNR